MRNVIYVSTLRYIFLIWKWFWSNIYILISATSWRLMFTWEQSHLPYFMRTWKAYPWKMSNKLSTLRVMEQGAMKIINLETLWVVWKGGLIRVQQQAKISIIYISGDFFFFWRFILWYMICLLQKWRITRLWWWW